MTAIFACRACGSNRLEPVLSLGDMPLVNALLDDVDDEDARYPLEVVHCAQCNLVQITETVPPEILFREYSYFSSYSDTFVAHARAFARANDGATRISARESLVVEAASNDGYLLQFFAEGGIPVLGIEPARNVATAATARGDRDDPEFLDAEARTQARCASRPQR